MGHRPTPERILDLGLLPLLALIALVPLVLHQRRWEQDRLRASESADRHAALAEQTGLVPKKPGAEERHALTGTIEGIAVSLQPGTWPPRTARSR